MLRYNRNRARGRFFPLFSPRELFYGSVPGAWYDPTDLSTMFQDSTGTTPVTAVEQPVGRILDKSGNGNHASQSTAASRPTYRARYNLLTYSEQFDNAAWTKYVDTTISANVAVAPDGTTTADLMYPATSGTRGLYMAWSGTLTLTTSLYAKASGKSWLQVVGSGGATASGVWFNLTAGTVGTQKPGYTGTIQSVGNGWYRCVVSHPVQTNGFFEYRVVDADNVSVVTASGGADGLLIWGAQALTAADVTATGNAYQRIAAATVYDTAPVFRPYLAFDGLDDSLSTAAINFTSTDKMTVFVGASKLSDVAAAILTELSATTASNAGSFYIAAPEATGASGNFTYKSRGSLDITPTSPGVYLAPTTRVLSGVGYIAGDTAILRINGAQAVNSTGDQGTGNYGNYPLFIGRRGGTTLPFNGRLFSLIVRGAASSVTEIADTELWVNARTGAY